MSYPQLLSRRPVHANLAHVCRVSWGGSYINNEGCGAIGDKGEKTRVSLCPLVHTGCDLDFLCLKGDARILSRCKNKGKRMEERRQKQFSCSWGSQWVARLLAGIRLASSTSARLLLHGGACNHLLVMKHNTKTLITGLKAKQHTRTLTHSQNPKPVSTIQSTS